MATVNVTKKNNAKLFDIKTLVQAGINPVTGLPIKMESQCNIKPNIKKLLRIVDEQDAINRYRWFNLPDGLDGQLIERILYYRGQGMLFLMKADKKFYFLPYALDGTIDVYGRFTAVTPLPFNGTSSSEGKKGEVKPWIAGMKKFPKYEVVVKELTNDEIFDSCVLLWDYSNQESQTNISRQILQDPLIDVMSDLIPYMRTALKNSTGVKGMRVNDADQQSQATLANSTIDKATLNGDRIVAILGNIDFQELADGQVAKAEEFLLAMQALDNLRLGFYGLENGGLFQKKSHVLQTEQQMNSSNVGLVYQDGLTIRQKFCDIVNSIWGLGISVEPSETVSNMDANFDGYVADFQDQTGMIQGEQNPIVGGDEDVVL